MNGVARWLLWLSTILTAVSGLAYAVMRYLLVNDDPFSALGHPLQPWALASHILVAPAMVFATGWFWGWHVLPRLRHVADARRSGLVLTALAVVMIASGYGLQVIAASWAKTVLAWTHGVSGVLFAGLLVGHQIIGRRAVRSTRASPDGHASGRHIQVVSRTGRAARTGHQSEQAVTAAPFTTVRRPPPLSSLDSNE